MFSPFCKCDSKVSTLSCIRLVRASDCSIEARTDDLGYIRSLIDAVGSWAHTWKLLPHGQG